MRNTYDIAIQLNRLCPSDVDAESAYVATDYSVGYATGETGVPILEVDCDLVAEKVCRRLEILPDGYFEQCNALPLSDVLGGIDGLTLYV